jgi:ADP-ribose pyrophosphatase YjhB (NUDIX family)
MYNPNLNTDVYVNDEIKHCIKCGGDVSLKMPPDGENHLRHVCNQCQHIHYQNPKIVVGSISIHEGKILLCKRAIQPRYDYWTLPAGFMENGETTFNGAWRETFEEACANIDIQCLFSIVNIPKIAQVHMFYLATFNGKYAISPESSEVKLFNFEEIPWDNLAFESVSVTLKKYIECAKISKTEFKLEFDLPYHYTVTNQYS